MKKIIFILLTTILFLNSFASEETKKDSTALEVTAAELKEKNSGNKKENFTDSMVMIIDDIKDEIQKNREKAETLSKKAELTAEEKVFMDELFTKYRIDSKNYAELLDKMILPPTSLILAQASLESGWANSNLAQDGNNLFGMKSFDASEPRIKKGGSVYRKYASLRDSVKDYIINISRHNSYKSLRAAIKKGEDSLKLTEHLAAYCEDPEYGKDLVAMINNNNFMQYDV